MLRKRSIIIIFVIASIFQGTLFISFNNDFGNRTSKKIMSFNQLSQCTDVEFSYQNTNNPEIMWEFFIKTDGNTYGFAVGDVNNDGDIEIIFGLQKILEPAFEGIVYALNGSGDEIWNYEPTIDHLGTAPALGDIDNDSKLEMIIGGNNEYVMALEDEGTSRSIKWQYPIGPSSNGFADPTLGDIDNDSQLEVIVGGPDGSVTALEAENGGFKWEFNTNSSVFSSVALGDINNDQKIEIIVGCWNGFVYAINGIDGTHLWNYSTSYRIGDPLLADLDNDQEMEVIFGDTSGTVTVLDGTDGSCQWDYPLGAPINVNPALGDVNNDKKLDVVIGSMNGNIYALNGEDGVEIWSKNENPSSSATLGDIDNDKQLEVIFGSNNNLTALNGEDGGRLWSMEFDNPIESPPALYDIDKDQKLEIVFQTSWGSSIYALKPPNSGHHRYWTNGGSAKYTLTQNLNDIDPDMDFLSTDTENFIGTSFYSNDSDEDNMLDGWEYVFSPDLDPSNNDSYADPDTDTLFNIQEYLYDTDPTKEDTDNDNMPDWWEVKYELPPRNDTIADTDNDGLLDFLEFDKGTNPNNPDSDNDGLEDGEEVYSSFTYPDNPDSDNDEMPDGWEWDHGLDPNKIDRTNDPDNDGLNNIDEFSIHTHPNNNDSDNDRLSDGEEVYGTTGYRTDPNLNDSDHDSMIDGWECEYNLNPLDSTDSEFDQDGDGLTNLEEFRYLIEYSREINPNLKDTDNDGLSDGEEVKGTTGYFTDPILNDTDNDSLLDGLEVASGLDPTNNDTDSDGDLDGDEFGGFLLDPKNPWLNTQNRELIIVSGISSMSLLVLGVGVYRFLFIPRRMQIKELWNRRVLRLYHREEDVLDYAGKAKKLLKKINDD